MPELSIGDKAPSFRLPSAQGADVGLEEFRGRSIVVWFSKGMACPFCRQQMTQLARGYPEFKARGAELLQITGSKPAQARLYAKQFTLPYPYLCDPDRTVRRSWGMDVRSHGPLYYAKNLIEGMRAPRPENDFGTFAPPPGELPNLLTDDDMGLFVLDKAGVVRYASTSAAVDRRALPGNDEILRQLERATA
jgi:peroxiredoxin